MMVIATKGLQMKITIVNNTGTNFDKIFHDAFIEYAKTGILSEEISDLFAVKIVHEFDVTKVIVNWA